MKVGKQKEEDKMNDYEEEVAFFSKEDTCDHLSF